MPDQAEGGNPTAFCGFRHELLADRSQDRPGLCRLLEVSVIVPPWRMALQYAPNRMGPSVGAEPSAAPIEACDAFTP